MTENRRQGPRQRTMLAAQIELNNGGSALDCLVRNLSDGGARIKIEAAHTLPDRFQLHLIKTSTRRAAEVKWRTATELGIEFTS
jgi:hypothetical protein